METIVREKNNRDLGANHIFKFGNLLHHKNMAQSYNQHKMAEQLLADEEQMAAEQERIINQSSLLIQ